MGWGDGGVGGGGFAVVFFPVLPRPSTADIVEGHPAVDEVIPYFYERKGRHAAPRGYLRFLKEIISRHFDICFILHPSVRSHLIPVAAGIPVRVGFDSTLPFLLTHRVKDTRHLGLKHESEYALDVVRVLGAQAPEEKIQGAVFFSEHERKTKNLFEKKVVAIHPGSSCASKRWPMERYEELVSILLQRTACRVAVVGGEAEKELGEVLRKLDSSRVENLTGRLDLKELAAFFSRCELLVSNDSGPVHVAAGAGTRALVIYGRNRAGLNRERWRPLGNHHRLIQKNVGCVVCLADACTIDFECLKAVSAEEVFSAASEMLAEKKAFANAL